jgi:hypothetical protein
MTNENAYFFMASEEDKSLFLHFLQRPQLEGEATQLSNLDFQYYFYGNFK